MRSGASIDALTSATLKDVREHWWSDDFSDFLQQTLRPRPGNRILDVGCGVGTSEVSMGRRHLSQIRLVGVDVRVEKVIEARRTTASHNQRVGLAAGDARRLPFRDGAFDSTYCVAVLQHVCDVGAAVAELARVTRSGGRIVAVEPDNTARYSYSSVPAGVHAFDMARRFFSALAVARGDVPDGAVGPRLATLFTEHGVEPLEAKLFPVSLVRIGAPADAVWAERRASVEKTIAAGPGDQLQALGREYLGMLAAYADEASHAGTAFVEIQNTMLFATVGQKA